MKSCIVTCFLFLLFTFLVKEKASGQGLDKSDFYAVLASGKLQDINDQLTLIRSSSIAEKNAYEGVLLMKKSGMVSSSKEKINLFKSGRSKLESSITREYSNAEFRFFRVIIQEHAPRIVKYSNDLEQDCRMIMDNFKSLSQLLQQVITDYSKKSKFLKVP